MPRRWMAGGALLMTLASWMVFGVLSPAAADMPNGDPCAGQELTLKVNGQAGTPIVPYGPVTIQGVLHCGTIPIRNAQVDVAAVGYVPAGVPAVAPAITTGLDGSFSYIVPPGPDRVLGFSYTSYSDDPGPSVSATVKLFVRPTIQLQIDPRRVRNGYAIAWTLTVLGGPFPPQGITLDPQVRIGRWLTFDQVVVHHEGTSRVYVYRFTRTYRPTTYPFRLSMPATGSGDYPYTSGASNVVKVRVSP